MAIALAVSIGAPPALGSDGGSVVLSFSSDRTEVPVGQGVLLSWASVNADSCRASGDWSGTLPTEGTHATGPLDGPKSYTLVCRNGDYRARRTISVAVVDGPITDDPSDPGIEPTSVDLSFVSDRAEVVAGESVLLSWTSANADSCRASGDWSGAVPTEGTHATGPLDGPRSYTLVCRNGDYRARRTINIAVVDPSVRLSFVSDRVEVPVGQGVLLSWTSVNAEQCRASGDWSGTLPTEGTHATGPLDGPRSYTLVCRNDDYRARRTISVAVVDGPIADEPTDPGAEQPSVALSFVSDRTEVAAGESVLLSWTSANAEQCRASGDWSGAMPTDGTHATGPLDGPKSYTLVCRNGDYRARRTISIAVEQPPPPPSLALQASATEVRSGQTATLSWSGTSVENCQASGAWSGPRAASGTETIGPLSGDASFTLTCQSASGNLMSMTSVLVTEGGTTLTWQAPRQNIDGTPLIDLQGYRIYVGFESRNYTSQIDLSNPSATNHFVELPRGQYYLAMTAIDAQGNESGYSNEVVKTVN